MWKAYPLNDEEFLRSMLKIEPWSKDVRYAASVTFSLYPDMMREIVCRSRKQRTTPHDYIHTLLVNSARDVIPNCEFTDMRRQVRRGKRITIAIPVWVSEKIKLQALANNLSRSQFIRVRIKQHLEKVVDNTHKR